MSNLPIADPRLQGLYAITQDGLDSATLYAKTEAILAGGARILQYRDKSHDADKRLEQASWLKRCCEQYSSLFLINDDIELAERVAADGVHLGKDDTSYEQARQRLGDDAVIGLSCYNDIQLARHAEAIGASYAAFGAFFSSPTKPLAAQADLALLRLAKSELNIPVCCIGGIRLDNSQALLDAHADMLAVISELYCHEHPQTVARAFSQTFSLHHG